jgi:fatty acid desaturase
VTCESLKTVTDPPAVSGVSFPDDRIKKIQRCIVDEERRLREAYPFLRHQDALGMTICLVSCLSMILMGYLYIKGVSPWWLTILVSGFWAGILNEVEHDLMHFIYFKKNKWAHDFMMVLVWAFRGNYMSPWNRRKVHLHHHKTSGSVIDVETRMTGLGMSWSLLRILLMLDTLWVLLITRKLERESKGHYSAQETKIHMFPFTWNFFALWVSLLLFQVYHAAVWIFGIDVTLPNWLHSYNMFLNTAWVVYLAPALLRTAALHIISSNTHYSGESLHLLDQTQSQGAWFFWPLQPFCFNFGKTHCIHHIVVQQPFYLRQMVAPRAYEAMSANGVKFNDYGTFVRRNMRPEQTA